MTNTRKFAARKFMAGALLAGVATVGVGGVGVVSASAQTTDSSTSPSTSTCVRELIGLRADWPVLQGRIDVLQRARNQALEQHRWEAAEKIERQILDLQAKQAAVAVHIHVLEQRCG
jgi:hypothetical protein